MTSTREWNQRLHRTMAEEAREFGAYVRGKWMFVRCDAQFPFPADRNERYQRALNMAGGKS